MKIHTIGYRDLSLLNGIITMNKLLRMSLIASVLASMYITTTFLGSMRRRVNKPVDTVLLVSPREVEATQQSYLESFSFAYNVTHLWSTRLPDANYYSMLRSLPCRSANYTGGRKGDEIDSCDSTTLKEYSLESTLHAQKWIYDHQNPADCTNKKFAVIHQYAWSGFGSTVHQILWAFGTAVALDRIAVYEAPGNWVGNTDGLPLKKAIEYECFLRGRDIRS